MSKIHGHARKKPRKVNKYRSKFEQHIATDLRKKGVEFEYETLKIPFKVPESKHTYKPDFILPSGICIEAKGRFDNDARKKMAVVIEQSRGTRDIRMLFMRDQPLQKGAKNFYSDWCNARGIKFAIGGIPDEWLAEKEPDLT